MSETRIIEKLRRNHPIDAFDCGEAALINGCASTRCKIRAQARRRVMSVWRTES